MSLELYSEQRLENVIIRKTNFYERKFRKSINKIKFIIKSHLNFQNVIGAMTINKINQ